MSPIPESSEMLADIVAGWRKDRRYALLILVLMALGTASFAQIVLLPSSLGSVVAAVYGMSVAMVPWRTMRRRTSKAHLWVEMSIPMVKLAIERMDHYNDRDLKALGGIGESLRDMKNADPTWAARQILLAAYLIPGTSAGVRSALEAHVHLLSHGLKNPNARWWNRSFARKAS